MAAGERAQTIVERHSRKAIQQRAPKQFVKSRGADGKLNRRMVGGEKSEEAMGLAGSGSCFQDYHSAHSKVHYAHGTTQTAGHPHAFTLVCCHSCKSITCKMILFSNGLSARI